MDKSEDIIILSDDEECAVKTKKPRTILSGRNFFDDIYVESEKISTRRSKNEDDFDEEFDAFLESPCFVKKKVPSSCTLSKRVSTELNREFENLKNSIKKPNIIYDLPCTSSSLMKDTTPCNEVIALNEEQTIFFDIEECTDDLQEAENDDPLQLVRSSPSTDLMPISRDSFSKDEQVNSVREGTPVINSPTIFSNAILNESPCNLATEVSPCEDIIQENINLEPNISKNIAQARSVSSSSLTDVPSLISAPPSKQASQTDGVEGAASKSKRARRTKEEIEHEKLVKEVNRVRREMNAAKNSKCEQYLFCYVNVNILAIDDEIKVHLTQRFTERSISEQLIFDDKCDMKIFWKRKHVDAFIEEGKLHTSTNMNSVGAFMSILSADSFTDLVKTKKMTEFLDNQFASYKASDPQLTVAVLGKCGLRDSTLNDVLFDAFERFRVQFRFTKNALELSFLVAQMHRAIAKSEKKSERESLQLPVIAMEKGIREGEHLVRDWWSRMLDQMHRLSEEQKRAIVDRYPSPFELMEVLLAQENAGEAMFQLASIEVGRNKRIGPVIAQKIFTMLTSWDGSEIIYAS